MLFFALALYLMFLFSGNMTNIAAVFQPSSSCQQFQLLTIFVVNTSSISQSYFVLWGQRILLFICSSYQSSLSFFFLGCRPRFSHLAASLSSTLVDTSLTKSEEKGRLLTVYTCEKWLNVTTIHRLCQWKIFHKHDNLSTCNGTKHMVLLSYLMRLFFLTW